MELPPIVGGFPRPWWLVRTHCRADGGGAEYALGLFLLAEFARGKRRA
jgi:hypothetical protein